uniref:Short-chain dehydrogenase/reductase family protein n=1 Tax=Mycena chlorophos TaxID=658473 RepID=A0ABQ0LEX1_MYCCL|nr:short-chain dehydrogenase/reductase family protein [Mycena chlorophos]
MSTSLPTFTFESTADEVATALADNIKGKNVLITGTSLNGIGFEAARVIANRILYYTSDSPTPNMSTLPTFTFESTADEVAIALADNIKGKNVLITGTSLNGIGFEAARVIAKYANLVIITGYNDQRQVPFLTLQVFLPLKALASLKLSEAAIKQETPSANIRRLTLDLSSLAAVRKAAAEVNTYPEPHIDVLIHNAAAAVGPFKLTADGFESQMATSFIGPFLLTKLIAPKLLSASAKSGSTPRVVYLSSMAHVFGPGVTVTLDLLKKPDAGRYNAVTAYAEAKAAAILTAAEISRRSKGKILGFSLHPGVIHTNINQAPDAIPVMQSVGILTPRGVRSEDRAHRRLHVKATRVTRRVALSPTHLRRLPNAVYSKLKHGKLPATARRRRRASTPHSEHEDFNWKTIEQGAATTITAAFDPRIESAPGAYLDDSNVATDKVVAQTSSLDPVAASELWITTEELVGEKFEF